MLSDRLRRETANERDSASGGSQQPSLRPRQESGPALDAAHPAQSLQRTLGNHVVESLHASGQLGAALPTPQGASQAETPAEEAAPEEDVSEMAPMEADGVGGAAGSSDGGSTADGGTGAESEAVDEPAEEAAAEAEGAAAEPAAGGGGEGAAVATAPQSPEEDPAFQAVVQQVEAAAKQERRHPSATAASADAEAAMQGPTNEKKQKAAAAQVGKMDEAASEQAEKVVEQDSGAFDSAGLKELLLQRIEDLSPKSLDQARTFSRSNGYASVIATVQGKVDEERAKAQRPVKKTTEKPPKTEGIERRPSEPLTPPPIGDVPPITDAERAAPKPKPAVEVSTPFATRVQSMNQPFTDNDITEQQLARANEPTFTDALRSKRDAEHHASQAPVQYRNYEQEVLSGAKAEAGTVVETELHAMHEGRETQLLDVADTQQQTKSKDDEEYASLLSQYDSIYNQTKKKVDTHLNSLEQTVISEFTEGAKEAQSNFEVHAERLRLYLADRYEGFTGFFKSGWDQVTSLPKRVDEIITKGRSEYLNEMAGVIDGVVATMASGLVEAKRLISEGLNEIKTETEKLDPALREVGKKAAEEIRWKFDALEQTVEAKKVALVDSLARRYTENLQAVDDRLQTILDENRGIVGDAVNKIRGVINTVGDLKDLLLNVLKKVAAAIGAIIDDPIGFLGNLITGVKQGLQNFIKNLKSHLLEGVIKWLVGTVGEAGIQLPEQWDLKGTFGFVMQILGLTYENIHAQAVQVLGEETVAALEETFEMFMLLEKEGVTGLWRYIKEKIGDIKTMVLGKIEEIIRTEVIQAGIDWILGLLGPVGAFIKACRAIYDIVSFFVIRAKEIGELVAAALDSILEIAAGNIGGAAKLVEDALARSIPLLIGFLAKLLKLGDIPKRVQGLIETVRAPINNGIQWVLEQAKAAVQRLGGALFGQTEETGETRETADPSDHAAFARHAATLLKEAPLRDGESVLKGAQRFAAEKEPVLSAQLGAGLGLRYVFETGEQATADGDLDFTVVIAPNDTRHEDELPIPDDPYNPGESAPGIGNIQLHGKKPSSLRDRPQIWQLESEHVLPFRVGATLWEALSLYLPERGWPEDRKQTTIMIYERAARIKTEGDTAIINSFKSEVSQLNIDERFQLMRARYEAGDESALSDGRELLATVLAPYRAARDDAVARTVSAIEQENQEIEKGYNRKNSERRAPPGESEPPKPSADEVRAAAEQQFDDVLTLVAEAVLSREELSRKLDRILGR